MKGILGDKAISVMFTNRFHHRIKGRVAVLTMLFGLACCGTDRAAEGRPQPGAWLSRGIALEPALDRLATEVIGTLETRKMQTVAVVGFTEIVGSESQFGKFLAEEMTTRFFQAKRFTVVERSRLDRVLGELQLQGSGGLVDPDSIKKLGKILGVDAILTGTYTDLRDAVRVNARLIGTEDGEVFAAAASSILVDDAIVGLLGPDSLLAKARLARAAEEARQAAAFLGKWGGEYTVRGVRKPYKMTLEVFGTNGGRCATAHYEGDFGSSCNTGNYDCKPVAKRVMDVVERVPSPGPNCKDGLPIQLTLSQDERALKIEVAPSFLGADAWGTLHRLDR